MQEIIKAIDNLGLIREKFIGILEEHSIKQLIFIPNGFRNNLFWNAAHIVVTQQLLCYYLTDNKMYIEKEWIDKYKKGTYGNIDLTANEIDDLIELLIKTPKFLKKDYEMDKFHFYKTYSTSFDLTLQSVEEAILYLNVHDGIHLGVANSIKKLV